MCRFIAYLGQPIIIENLVLKASNSLLQQSIEAKEATIRTNGDGFGIGWYTPSISDRPGTFTSILPAWNDLNLMSICQKIKTPSFFAHVRAANQGEVTQLNCHPFVYDDLLFMHNGLAANFEAIKRPIQNFLDDDIFSWIKGNTDSEHMFAITLQYLKAYQKPYQCQDMANALRQTVKHILALSETVDASEPCFLNLCITNGKKMVACRYTNCPKEPARSLYYSFIPEGAEECVMITSEKLTQKALEWHPITNGEIMLVNDKHQISFESL